MVVGLLRQFEVATIYTSDAMKVPRQWQKNVLSVVSDMLVGLRLVKGTEDAGQAIQIRDP